MTTKPPRLRMEIVSDPEELARFQREWELFDRNFGWFQSRLTEITANYPGKCVCVSEEELFVADTAEQVLALARAAHPDDHGRFTWYIPREKKDWVYDLSRPVVGV
jgi:hypothetical protein